MLDSDFDRPTRKLRTVRPPRDMSWQELLEGEIRESLVFDGTSWTDNDWEEPRAAWGKWIGRPAIRVSIDVADMDSQSLRMCSSVVAEFVRSRSSL